MQLRTYVDNKAVRGGAQRRRTESAEHKVTRRAVVRHYLGKVSGSRTLPPSATERTSPSAAKEAMGEEGRDTGGEAPLPLDARKRVAKLGKS